MHLMAEGAFSRQLVVLLRGLEVVLGGPRRRLQAFWQADWKLMGLGASARWSLSSSATSKRMAERIKRCPTPPLSREGHGVVTRPSKMTFLHGNERFELQFCHFEVFICSKGRGQHFDALKKGCHRCLYGIPRVARGALPRVGVPGSRCAYCSSASKLRGPREAGFRDVPLEAQAFEAHFAAVAARKGK